MQVQLTISRTNTKTIYINEAMTASAKSKVRSTSIALAQLVCSLEETQLKGIIERNSAVNFGGFGSDAFHLRYEPACFEEVGQVCKSFACGILPQDDLLGLPQAFGSFEHFGGLPSSQPPFDQLSVAGGSDRVLFRALACPLLCPLGFGAVFHQGRILFL